MTKATNGRHLLGGVLKVAIVSASFLITACNTATQTSAPAVGMHTESAEKIAAHAADRKAILAMAGDYRVTFDFQETVSFQEGYTPKEKYVSGAYEVVRVIEDKPNFISLQHILVVGNGEEMPLMPIKHWRQDWQYEPSTVLSYMGANTWKNEPVDPAVRAGSWSQSVYQVDDAPRYAAVAHWSHENGVSQWTSPPSKRPLPRRDATKRDDYHVIVARNRHALTPEGWVHEQDNAKVILSGETPQTLAHEIGINTYYRYDNFSVETAATYWENTKEFWTEVRSVWDGIAAAHPAFGLTVLGEASELYMQILGFAGDVNEGKMSASDAAREARAVINEYITLSPKSVQARLNSQNG